MPGGVESDIFISKLDKNLSVLMASTFLGGSRGEDCNSLAEDENGSIYVAGETGSFNYPVKTDAYCSTYQYGACDVFLSVIDPRLSKIEGFPMAPTCVDATSPLK